MVDSVQFQGKRAFFPLGTPNRAAAAAKARDIFLFLTVNGWPLTLAKYKPRSQPAPPVDTSEIAVGSFLDAVFSVCTNRSTTVTGDDPLALRKERISVKHTSPAIAQPFFAKVTPAIGRLGYLLLCHLTALSSSPARA